MCLHNNSPLAIYLSKNFQIIIKRDYKVATMLGTTLTKDEVEEFMREADVVLLNNFEFL